MLARQSLRVGKGEAGLWNCSWGTQKAHQRQNMNVSTIQEQIAETAKRHPDRGLTSLNKYLNEDWLRAAFKRIRKDGATGIDGVSAREYQQNLDERLTDLVNRAKSGSYHAPAVRRTYIEKPGKRDEKRPLGIPTTEDKLLQKGAVMILEPVFENEFYDFSYGFRPGRGAHDALAAIREAIMGKRIGWIVEADIRKFYDTLSHSHLREMLRRRVRDGRPFSLSTVRIHSLRNRMRQSRSSGSVGGPSGQPAALPGPLFL